MKDRSGLLSNPLVLGIGGFVIGLLVGWFLLGYSLFPVQYSDADPWDMNPAGTEQWIVMTADSYTLNQNQTLAQQRLRGFTKQEIEQTLRQEFTKRNQEGDAEGAAQIQAFAELLGVSVTGGTPAAQPTPGPATGRGGVFDNLGMLLLGLAGIILVVALALFLYTRFRGRAQPAPSAATTSTATTATGARTAATQPSGLYEEPATAPPMTAPAAAAAATATAPRAAAPAAKSLGTFAATYKFGEDNYDTSFTLETARGDFLGETGMGTSERMDDSKPDKVTAFDIWLFDKTDVRTVTQILMSEHAFNDQAIRQRLATKGELVLAEKGKSIRLETATLAVDATIVDLVYASTPGLPPNSHFQKLIVEMIPGQK